ncbi:MAG: hypothetical protein HKM89_08690 [Gemmatimonadales bacterium]|nr:hypothetical protein [Gemmatimonadales bacterium]
MTTSMPHRLALGVVLLFALGCASGERNAAVDPDSQRVRDSAIGASKLPGAAGVRGAIRAADSASARRAREDSVAAP